MDDLGDIGDPSLPWFKRPLALAVAAVVLYPSMLSTVDAATATPGVTSSVVLLQPGTNIYVGVLLERCVGDTATIRVVLATPKLLEPQNALLVFIEGIHTPAIRARANGDMPEIAAFEGLSAIGCIAPGSKAVLALNVGGPLAGLDIVMGSGEMKEESHRQ